MSNARTVAHRAAALGYVAAVLAPCAALFAHQALPESFRHLYFFLFYPTVFVVAVAFGVWPGIVCTFLSTALVYYFLVPPHFFDNVVGLLPVVVFFLMGIAISTVAGQLKATTQRVKISERALKDALRVRDDFLSIASHELRTPITSLRMQLQLMQRSTDPKTGLMPTPERLLHSMEISIRQVDRLTKMVEDLLDISRIRAGKVDFIFERFNLKELIEEVVGRQCQDTKATSCPIHVEVKHGVEVEADRFRIEQVMQNLLSNAVKYGAGKPIYVSASVEGSSAQVKVRDLGDGIPKEKQEKIFERFERVISKENISGWGLGLYIAKQVVDAHRGRIHVESEPGQGSTFTVEIPVRQFAAATPPPDRSEMA